MPLAKFINNSNSKLLQPIIENEVLLAFLPIIYVGWTDAEFSKSELDSLKNAVKSSDWLETEEKN